MSYVITKQEPPFPVKRKGNTAIYPFLMMEPGDYTTIDPRVVGKPVTSIRTAMSMHQKRSGQWFTSKVDKETGILHVWRVS